jgi:hypothetical protein
VPFPRRARLKTRHEVVPFLYIASISERLSITAWRFEAFFCRCGDPVGRGRRHGSASFLSELLYESLKRVLFHPFPLIIKPRLGHFFEMAD